MFKLDKQLQQDTVLLARSSLNLLLLMNNSVLPWLILVPRRSGVKEIFELPDEDQQQLMVESSYIAKNLMEIFHGEKMNIGAIGNVVSQLHVHHVVRYQDDAVWPKPVWGVLPTTKYAAPELEIMRKTLEPLWWQHFIPE